MNDAMTGTSKASVIFLLFVATVGVSHSQEPLTLDKYTCEQFLADSTNKTDGTKLLKSLMMISWATGYAAAYQKGLPRADSGAIDLMAGILGNECRKSESKNAVEVIVDAVNNFAQSVKAPVASSAAPSAGQITSKSRWEQNGSIVHLVADGATRKFYYDSPRSELLATGVKPGTLLFDGSKKGSNYSGTMYAFTNLCQPKGFSANGSISDDEKQVTLRGKSPEFETGCKITKFHDATLVFTFIPEEGAK